MVKSLAGFFADMVQSLGIDETASREGPAMSTNGMIIYHEWQGGDGGDSGDSYRMVMLSIPPASQPSHLSLFLGAKQYTSGGFRNPQKS